MKWLSMMGKKRRKTAAERLNIDYNAKIANWGYRDVDSHRKEVAYHFGYGLSYTSFLYAKPDVRVEPNGLSFSV